MPFLDIADTRLHYQIDGREGVPWLLLSNSLGTSLEMWEPQMPDLLRHFRVLRYDTRGHGRSSVPRGPYDIGRLGSDVIALMDGLRIERAHFCGLSMGGMTGIWLGIHEPSRIRRLALCNTSARIGTPEAWNARIEQVRADGMSAIASAVIERWFTESYVTRAPSEVAQVRNMLLATDPEGYAANCAAVRGMDQRRSASMIAAPTLVISGTHDKATPAEDGKWLAGRIAGARYVELDAAHLSNWEQSGQFTRGLVDFLTEGATYG